MVFCGIGFSKAWQGVQGARKRPPAGSSRRRPDTPLAHLDLAIPCRVASPQSPTPLHRTEQVYNRRESNSRKHNEEQVGENDGCIGPSFEEEAPADAHASLSVPVDSALVAERNSD